MRSADATQERHGVHQAEEESLPHGRARHLDAVPETGDGSRPLAEQNRTPPQAPDRTRCAATSPVSAIRRRAGRNLGASWRRSKWHPNELYRRLGFIVTNLAWPAERVVAFYNQRGTAEQWIKKGKGAIKWTRLSRRTFAANAGRLQLHALAYNLGNFMRTLALPETTEPWSLTSLREKLIKIGAKIVSHGRYVTFQLAARAAQEVRLDAGKSARLPPRRSRPAAAARCALTVVETPRKGDPGLPAARNRGNIG
jgi:hypothetical protein